jgi:pSer/pThr/pTyr-binding forkhead associated (FHA) protein
VANAEDMATETLRQSVPLELKPIPPAEGTETVPIKEIPKPRYVLVDKSGRYRFWTDKYAEYGRQDFLDLDAAEYISRQHFALKYDGDVLYIADLGSRNGTKVNGVDIRGKGWVPLKLGDVVDVANVITLVLTEINEQ